MNKVGIFAVLAVAALGCATVSALPEHIEALNEGTHFEHFTNWLNEHKPHYMNDYEKVAEKFVTFASNLDKILLQILCAICAAGIPCIVAICVVLGVRAPQCWRSKPFAPNAAIRSYPEPTPATRAGRN